MKTVCKWIGKFFLGSVTAIILVIVLVIGGLNMAKYRIYRDYYAIQTNICTNPGLNDDFVCQGIAAAENHGVVLVSGYMKDHSSSRIYVTTLDSESYYVQLKKGNETFTGHVGGIATTGDTVYLANDSRIHTISLSDLLSAKEGDILDVGEGISVNNSASFVYTDERYLYVGEFHNGEDYTISGHENETAEGTHYAICTQYDLQDLTTPTRVYSIRNKVQGICFTPNGKVILSTSYGLADTVYYVYNENEATYAGKTMDGAPVYYLDKLAKEFHGPAMGEDLDYYDGRVITLFESASNKYVFGKLFGANNIVGLEF